MITGQLQLDAAVADSHLDLRFAAQVGLTGRANRAEGLDSRFDVAAGKFLQPREEPATAVRQRAEGRPACVRGAAEKPPRAIRRRQAACGDRQRPAEPLVRPIRRRAFQVDPGRDAEGLAVVGSVLDVSTVDKQLESRELVEDAALTMAARALIAAAQERTESRGCHVRTDFTERSETWQRSQLVRLTPTGQPVLADPVLVEGVA